MMTGQGSQQRDAATDQAKANLCPFPQTEDAAGQGSGEPVSVARRWSTRKKDADARRGLFRHPSGGWGIRFMCGLGHVHQEHSGADKRTADRTLERRRTEARDTPGWCPVAERRAAAERARAEKARRVPTFETFTVGYLRWAKEHHQGYETEAARIGQMVKAFGKDRPLDGITLADVERFLDETLAGRAAGTRNRYRTLLHAMFNRAIRHGLTTSNPVTAVRRLREPGGRIVCLSTEDEAAILTQLAPAAMLTGRATLDARRPDLRPLFLVSVHTGLRWSEQMRLVWGDVDMLAGTLTVRRSKSGYARTVPVNSIVRGALLDLAAQRTRPDDPDEPVFRCPYTEPTKFFPRGVERAQRALRDAGREAGRLDGYTWHGNRHTFASRLVMAGVDLRSVQVLGGWRSLAMVERYSHLSPGHLRDAVERLAAPSGRTKLRDNFEFAGTPLRADTEREARMT